MTDEQIKEEIKHINTRNQEYIAVNNRMTKKIIDGVDVAKCRNFTSEWDFNNCGHICKGTECKYKRLWYKKQLKAKEQELNDYKKQFKADTKEMEDYQNEITRHLESIEYWQHQAEAKEQECEKLKEINAEIQESEIELVCISYSQ